MKFILNSRRQSGKKATLQTRCCYSAGLAVFAVFCSWLYFVPGESLAEPENAALQQEYASQSWGRSPFVEQSVDDPGLALPVQQQKPQGLSGLVLKGILMRDGNKSALVNRTFVREGDTIRGLEVVHIGKDEIVFKQGDQEAKLRMGSEEALLPMIHLTDSDEEQ